MFKWKFSPDDPNADHLMVSMTLDQPYGAIAACLESLFPGGKASQAKFGSTGISLKCTESEQGRHTFVEEFNGSFLARISVTDDSRPQAHVVIDNEQPRPGQNFPDRNRKEIAVYIAQKLAKELASLGYITDADKAKFLLELKAINTNT